MSKLDPLIAVVNSMAAYEKDPEGNTDEYEDNLEMAGFYADDYRGEWIGPDGSSMDQGSVGGFMKRALDAWLADGTEPGYGEDVCLSNIASALGIKVDFSKPPS